MGIIYEKRKKSMLRFIFLSLLLLAPAPTHEHKRQAEYIYRLSSEQNILIDMPKRKSPELYPWQKECVGPCHFITKEYFRCKGSSINPPLVVHKEGKEDIRATPIVEALKNIACQFEMIKSLSIHLT